MKIKKDQIVAIYKKPNMTSYDVIRSIKKELPNIKVGHGGTLDPLAEGVLVVATGSATKKLTSVLHLADKEYEAVIELGKVSETDDSEGPIRAVSFTHHPTEEEIRTIVSSYTGEILQTPPSYSAIKVHGVPAYRRKRRGEVFILTPRTVSIHSITMSYYDYPFLHINITCGAGTYIRSLARDIGRDTNCGAYLFSLKRTRVGHFTLSDAVCLPG